MQYPDLWEGCFAAYAPLLGPTGLSVFDWWNGKHGTMTGFSLATAWPRASGFTALSFSQSAGTLVSLGTLTIPQVISCSAWILPTRTTSASFADSIFAGTDATGNISPLLFDHGRGGQGFGMLWTNSTGSANFSNYSTQAMSTSQLQHICSVRYGSSGAWTTENYLNGRFINSGTTNIDPDTTPRTYGIGRIGGVNSNWFDGVIVELFIAARRLMPGEIRLLSSAPGVAYTPRDRTIISVPSGFSAAWARQRSAIIGGGVI